MARFDKSVSPTYLFTVLFSGSHLNVEVTEGGEKVMLTHFHRRVVAFLKSEEGPTAVEYAIMMALIIVVCVVAITALGSNSSNTYSYVGSKVGRVPS
jgi:pilus assembly protein Flp/PilA